MDKQRLQEDWGYLIKHAGKGETEEQLAEWFSSEEISFLRLYEERDRALEAVERLRGALGRIQRNTIDANMESIAREALAATEPAAVETHSKSEFRRLEIQREAVELPKCDHCGAIACGTDCNGSSHYTPDNK